MFKKNKKIIFNILSAVSVVSVTALSASCSNKEDVNKWDTDLSINYRWYNPGWDNVKEEFEKNLTNKYNELKNQSSDLEIKNSPDVKIHFNTLDDKNILYQDLRANKSDVDFGGLPYYFLKTKWNSETDVDNEKIQMTSQSATLKFDWSANDNDYYSTGLAGDKLRDSANNENTNQFAAPYGEFPTWNDNMGKPYYFDGSKYQAFYKEMNDKNLTYIYRGAIYIAGDMSERNAIINDWESKNFDQFLNHGIVYSKTSSGGGFKYQAALLARHFNKTLEEVVKALDASKDYILAGQNPAAQIGKQQDNSKYYNIAFSDEGEFNWTPKSWGKELFKPTGFESNNRVVRILSFTNPAPYDLIMARSGMNPKQVQLMKEALASFDINNNLFGIYTGMNKFIPTDKTMVKTMLKVQNYAESTEAAKPIIPNIV